MLLGHHGLPRFRALHAGGNTLIVVTTLLELFDLVEEEEDPISLV
jgi:hypothetical protein